MAILVDIKEPSIVSLFNELDGHIPSFLNEKVLSKDDRRKIIDNIRESISDMTKLQTTDFSTEEEPLMVYQLGKYVIFAEIYSDWEICFKLLVPETEKLLELGWGHVSESSNKTIENVYDHLIGLVLTYDRVIF